jgi:hypothetical protein
MLWSKKFEPLLDEGRRAARDVSDAAAVIASEGTDAARAASAAVTLLAALAVCTLAVAALTLIVVCRDRG